MKRNEDNLRDLQDNIKHSNIQIIGAPEEDKKKDHEKILEEIIVENFPKMVSLSVIFSFHAIFQVLQCAFLIFHVFSDFVIFQFVKWMSLIFHDFQFSCHIPCPTVDISKFSTFFSFPRHISRSKVCISPFSVIFIFLAIFQVLQCAFLIFHVFQRFRHFSIQVDVSHFPSFSVFLPYSMSYSGHF